MSKDCLDASIFYQSQKDDHNISKSESKSDQASSSSSSATEPSDTTARHNNEPEASSSKDATLDITSESVEWEKCFDQPGIKLPYPDAKLQVDLAEVESISDLTGENVASNHPKPCAAEFSTTKLDKDRKKKQQELVAKSKQTREVKFDKSSNSNILFFNTHRQGPQAFFGKAVKSHKKICIITRSFKGIRGLCVGFLLAFDRYSNMCLIDVCEIWRQPLAGTAFYKEESLTVCGLKTVFNEIQTSSDKATDALPNRLQCRHVGQIFLRGSNVVLSCWL